MKRLFFVLFLLLFLSSYLYADNYMISTIRGYDKNRDIIELYFNYDDELNLYFLERRELFFTYWYQLYPDDIKQLRENLYKAKDWAKIAKENKTDISKAIPNSISSKGIMLYDSSWYTTERNITLRFVFASKENGTVSAIGLAGDGEKTKQNQFLNINFEIILFFTNQIDDFINAISPTTIEQAKAKHQQEKKTLELFQ